MKEDILREAQDAQLSPLLARIALVLADVEGESRARRFIDEIKQDGAIHALRHVDRPAGRLTHIGGDQMESVA